METIEEVFYGIVGLVSIVGAFIAVASIPLAIIAELLGLAGL